MRLVALAPVLAAGLLAGTPAAAPAALETIIQDDAQLLHRSTDEVRRSMLTIKGLGIDRVRLTAGWSLLTRDPDNDVRPANFDATDPAAYEQARWRALDHAVIAAHEAGLQILVDVAFWAPRWATSDPPGPRARTDISPQEYRAFAVAVARRYSGTFAPPVEQTNSPAPPQTADQEVLEMVFGAPPPPAPPPAPGPLPRVSMLSLWNEPNHPAFLLPQWSSEGRDAVPVSPHKYRSMVLAAYPAIKAVRSDVTVLVGNTSSTGGNGGRQPIPPLRFLRELACVDGHLRVLKRSGCESFSRIAGDGWAHHPYSLSGTPSERSSPRRSDDARLGDLDRLSRVLNSLVARGRIAPAMRGIYITEFGYETHRLGNRPGLSEGTQAQYLTWGEYIASRNPWVKMFGQFLLRDLPPAATAQSDSSRRPFGQYYTGLHRVDGTAKLAARTFVAGLFAQRQGSRVLLWGRLRLGRGQRSVRIERRVGSGRWTLVRTSPRGGGGASRFGVAGQGTFTRFAGDVAGARFRLVYRREDGRWISAPSVRPLVTALRPKLKVKAKRARGR
jgi:hypothetical protein